MENNFKSALWMLGWAVSVNLAVMASKGMSGQINSTVLVLARNLMGFLAMVPLLILPSKRREIFHIKQPLRQVANIIIVTIGTCCTYYAYRKLPLALATCIGFSGPFFTSMLSIVFLKEHISIKKWLVIFLGYSGIFLAMQPLHLNWNPAILVLLLANVIASIAIVNRKCIMRTDSPFTTLFWGNAGGSILAGFAAAIHPCAICMVDVLWLSLLSVMGLLSQFCYLSALKAGRASFVAPLEFSRIVIAAPLAFMIYSEIPSLYMGLGCVIILTAMAILTKLQHCK